MVGLASSFISETIHHPTCLPLSHAPWIILALRAFLPRRHCSASFGPWGQLLLVAACNPTGVCTRLTESRAFPTSATIDVIFSHEAPGRVIADEGSCRIEYWSALYGEGPMPLSHAYNKPHRNSNSRQLIGFIPPNEAAL